ncbi:MAG: hypothetical protein EA398_10850 [Deltaproteobacteria bacterium]|nr:MAG: hypothetical protein EA398_10850 [Deltaproteobacteria bacterium]
MGAALGAVLMAGSASAQSNFGDFTLSPGFLPDPAVVTGISGGNVDARQHGNTPHGGCVGMIASTPDHVMTLGGDFSYLRIRALSSGDTTLAIRGPNGWLCNDDGPGAGLDPVVEGALPAGRYEVFVGSFGGGNHQYTLSVTEIRGNDAAQGATTNVSTTGATMGQQAGQTAGQTAGQQAPSHDVAPSTGANFESFSIAPGFMPDPREFRGNSGGSVDGTTHGSTSHGPCRGMISVNPDHIMTLESGFPYLRVTATSEAGDTTMVIHGPDGYRCNDDFEGLNPGIEGEWPAGQYRIWIGSYGRGSTSNYPYVLRVTEFRR